MSIPTGVWTISDSAEKPPVAKILGDQISLTQPRKSIVGHLQANNSFVIFWKRLCQQNFIYHLWSELLFLGLPITDPLADQVLKNTVAEPKSKYASKKEDPVGDCFWHLSVSFSRTSLVT